MRRSRRSVLSAAALGLALAASGCTYMSPVQTKDFYQAADGTNANIEQDGAMYAGVRNALMVIEEDGTAEHAFLGVTSADGSASQEETTYRGAEVLEVEPGSPAADAGLREKDLIIGIDDTPVGGAAALTGVVRGLASGSTHQLEVVRDGAVQNIDVTLGVRPS